jgi:hypothetical protein
MFEQAFKNIDDILWKEAGCTTELDYTEQTSWLLFLKYLDDLEQDKSTEAALEGKKYTHILDEPYRWESWAAPKGKDGKLDHNKALTGDDLRDFVNGKLFPYLHGFKLPEFFKNEAELRALWSDPDTRKKLLNGLAEKGFGHEQLAEMQKIIDAEKSDIFDVLAYVAYALPPLTREERAARAKSAIEAKFNSKQQAFLDFVLAHYVAWVLVSWTRKS